jgi:hypothetical protein
MAWELVVSYRMRFNVGAGRGDILLNHTDGSGGVKTTPLNALTPDRFAAIASLLTSDKDHKIAFDGTTIDAGPEAP